MNGLGEPTEENVDRVMDISESQAHALERQGYAVVSTPDCELVKIEVNEGSGELDDLLEEGER